MGKYDTAQICMNGHVISSMASTYTENQKKLCSECGEETIMSCLSCNSFIKGYYEVPGVIGFYDFEKPKFCENCGTPFPWTVKYQNAANELIDLSETLSEQEKEDFKNSVTNLIKSSASSNVAQLKLKKYVSKAGTEIAKGMREILVDVVSETVKKSIWGN